MKINNIQIDGPNEVPVVIPRSGQDIVILAKAIIDEEEFDKLVPLPMPPYIHQKDGTALPDYKDTDYVTKMAEYSRLRADWMIMRSIIDSPGITFEKVDRLKPDTWNLLIPELREAFFSASEINRIISAVTEANGLDGTKIEEARKRFLASKHQASK